MNTRTVRHDPAKPRRRSLRLPHHDYAMPGSYFVTVCTERRLCLFGHIRSGVMHENALGRVVKACWEVLPQHYFHVRLDAFAVMPNHVHGILVLADEAAPNSSEPMTTRRHGLPEIVRAFKTFSSRRINEMHNAAGRKVWQRGYHEHVIRDEMSLRRMQHYIETNPQRWDLDRENPDHRSNQGAGLNPSLHFMCHRPT